MTKIIGTILKEINLIINIENKVTGAPAHLADPLKMYSCFIRIREKFSHSNYVDGDPNTGSMYLHGFNGDYDQVKSTRVLDSNSAGNPFLT